MLVSATFAGLAGFGRSGEDLAGLVFPTVALDGVKRSDVAAFEEVAFSEYLRGLREAGWGGDEVAVRFAYLAHGCVRFSVLSASLLLRACLDENMRKDLARILDQEKITVSQNPFVAANVFPRSWVFLRCRTKQAPTTITD